MSFTPEAIWGFLLLLLVAGVAWALIAYVTRDRGEDDLTEREDDPGPGRMKGDRKQPPNGV